MTDSRRRTLIQLIPATLTLGPVLGTAQQTLPLLEPVVITRDELDSQGGNLAFEAWFLLDGKKRMVGGLLLDLATVEPGRQEPHASSIRSPTVAFVSNCPHEACRVRLEQNPRESLSLAADGIRLPDRPLVFCPCHFSMFDPKQDVARLSGPGYRGLYRFILREQGSSIIVNRLESSVAALFGL